MNAETKTGQEYSCAACGQNGNNRGRHKSVTFHSKTHLDRGVEIDANRCAVGVWEDAAKKTKFPVNDNSSY